MNRLDALKKYFTTGTAESEGNILDAAFVPMRDYVEIINPPHASPRLLIGKKGSGKSAFVRSLRARLGKAHVPHLFLKPKDIQCNWPPEPASLGDLTYHSERAILEAIGAQIGTQLDGYVSEKENKLAILAEEKGLKDRDFVRRALRLLKPIGQAISAIDFDAFSKDLPPSPAELKALVESQLSAPSSLLYLVLDDTDQIASPAEPNHLNRIWSLLLAARFILEECPHIRAIITLRTEVWKRMCREEAGQRDQVDHFRDLVFWLNPDDSDIARILDRRLDLAKRDLGLTQTPDHYHPFFEGRSVVIPTTDETRSWPDFIVKRSRERPRDGVQLISALIEVAKRDNRDAITSKDVADAITAYSNERVDDLVREVGQECPAVREVIRSFAYVRYDGGGFKLQAKGLFSHLAGIPSRFGTRFMDRVLQPGRDDENAYLLWRYLHEIGFLNARASDASKAKGFKHILLKDDASLVSKERWNQVQTLVWEIHPAYRDYLISVQRERELAAEARAEGQTRPAGTLSVRRPRRH